MADDKRGTKRQCEHCGMKYYDLNRDPVFCPGCQEPYVEPAEPTPRKSKPAPSETPADAPTSSEVEVEPAATEAGAEVVSFEDADAEQGAGDDEAASTDDVSDGEEVENIGGEVDNSFVDDEDDDGSTEDFGLNTKKDEE